MFTRILKATLILVLPVVFGSAATAATKTTSFNVTASVADVCVIDSAGDLAFGPYDPSSGAPLDQTSDIVLRCTNGTPYTVDLSKGNASSYSPRQMDDGGSNTLDYNLYSDSGHSTIWGDGSGGSSDVSDSGDGMASGNEKTHTVYGRIPDQPTAVPASYSDVITVTVTY